VSFCGNDLNYKDVATTLNVLDYDTYFTATDLLLAGKYVEALVLFDNILSRGFSPQIFISGLNAHMRDLLMAKGPAISLVEFTGTLVERYKQQAALCREEFLFNAISLLTEADGKIRQSSNQRLLVELGLMKIAGLGQKKNDEVAEGITEDSFTTSFALPELVGASQPAPQPAPAPQPQVVQPVQPAPQPAPAPQRDVQTVKVEPVAEPKPRPRTTTQRSLSSSVSLSSMLDGEVKTATELVAAAEAEVRETASSIDPACKEKIAAAKDRIIEVLTKTRHRYGVFFDGMAVEGNVVRVTVPSEALADDIRRDKAELQKIFAQQSGAKGYIEIEVVVNERVKIYRPITLEDRLKHLMEKNERLEEMIQTLQLDAE
jgi:DNA polymerase-3 subunit gamma/tau